MFEAVQNHGSGRLALCLQQRFHPGADHALVVRDVRLLVEELVHLVAAARAAHPLVDAIDEVPAPGEVEGHWSRGAVLQVSVEGLPL